MQVYFYRLGGQPRREPPAATVSHTATAAKHFSPHVTTIPRTHISALSSAQPGSSWPVQCPTFPATSPTPKRSPQAASALLSATPPAFGHSGITAPSNAVVTQHTLGWDESASHGLASGSRGSRVMTSALPRAASDLPRTASGPCVALDFTRVRRQLSVFSRDVSTRPHSARFVHLPACTQAMHRPCAAYAHECVYIRVLLLFFAAGLGTGDASALYTCTPCTVCTHECCVWFVRCFDLLHVVRPHSARYVLLSADARRLQHVSCA